MACTALYVPLPFNPSTAPAHPALSFYALYGQSFPKTTEEWNTRPFNDDFYAANCRMRHVDGSWVESGRECWEWFRKLYSRFPNAERKALSMTVISNNETSTHEIHVEFLTKLGDIEVPQAFVYTLGKASEGKGTLGMQFVELRNYYDLRTMENAVGEKLL